jgi:hypothetical protein
MDKKTQDRLFDVVENIPNKVNLRKLKRELRQYFEECLEQGMSEIEAAKAGQKRLKEIMEK